MAKGLKGQCLWFRVRERVVEEVQSLARKSELDW